MRFILAILVYPIVFIADGKVTNKFKRSFLDRTEVLFAGKVRVRRNFFIYYDVDFVFSTSLICKKLRISLDAGV